MNTSKRGCWSCRVRRKRCDAKLPSCDTCDRLGICCEGYDIERPAWMDGGRQQREYCQMISSNIKRHRKARSSIQHSPPPTTLLLSPSTEQTIATPLDIQLTPSNVFIPEDDDLLLSGSTAWPFEPPLSPTFTPSLEQDAPFMSLPDDNSFETPHLLQHVPSFETQLLSSTPDEGILTMEYFDVVFYEIFPYHCLTDDTKFRGWLLALAGTSPLFKNIMIYSAICHREHDSTRPSSVDCTYLHIVYRRSNDYRDSLASLKAKVQDTAHNAPAHAVEEWAETLTCLVHCIWIEKTTAPRIDTIQGLLQQAIHLLLVTRKALQKSNESNSKGDTWLSSHAGDASQRLTADVISFHVLAEAVASDATQLHCLDCGPITSEDYMFELGADMMISPRIRKSCSLKALQSLLAIKKLQQWKQSSISQGKLSILELGRRALVIEQDIKHCLDMLQPPDEVPASNHVCCLSRAPWLSPAHHNACHSQLRSTATRVFTLATKIYLHVVVSGLNCNLPDLQEQIFSCNQELESMNFNDGYPISLAWAVCILASVSRGGYANDKSQNFGERLKDKKWFRELYDRMRTKWTVL